MEDLTIGQIAELPGLKRKAVKNVYTYLFNAFESISMSWGYLSKEFYDFFLNRRTYRCAGERERCAGVILP